MEKQIILLNGSSSAGKSTLAKALQALIEDKRKERYEIVSIDDFLKMATDDVIYEDDVYETSDRSAEASYTYLYPKEGYDLTVDTHFMAISECVNRILDGIL